LFAHDLATLEEVRIEMGVIGGCVVDVCSHLIVGRATTEIVNEPNRPMDRVNWDAINDPTPGPPPNEHVTVVFNPNMMNTAAVPYNYCFADINREGTSDHNVDVSDLLAVIVGWGPCAPAPSGTPGPPPHCAADVSPIICGNQVVNVADLLFVINSWGGCPANPICGDEPAVPAGPPGPAPETVSDCYNQASEAFPPGSADWQKVFDACLEALERMEGGG
jgi:hypothetical protein